jgi:hypothetical protein
MTETVRSPDSTRTPPGHNHRRRRAALPLRRYGTVILTSPSGQTYISTPRSALLFPSLCAPTGDLPAIEPGPPIDPWPTF